MLWWLLACASKPSPVAPPPVPTPADVAFDAWAPGLEVARIDAPFRSRAGDSVLTVVRVDPTSWAFSWHDHRTGGDSRTTRAWARDEGLTLAVNGGMYDTDYATHVGALRAGALVDPPNAYESVAVFERRPGQPASVPHFRIVDLDAGGDLDALTDQHAVVVQNLRFVKHDRENRWSKQEKRWSEAALAEDDRGRALFVYATSPYDMWTFNEMLLTLPLGVVAAQHLDGGPPASLYLRHGERKLELFGTHEAGIADGNAVSQDLPFVLGVRPREP
jgi:uncharacterized protein YigE (DUF2233 family)